MGTLLDTSSPSDPRIIRDGYEAEVMRIFREASDVGKAALLRLVERMAAGDDAHAAGLEYMVAMGLDAAEAQALTAEVLAKRSSIGARA